MENYTVLVPVVGIAVLLGTGLGGYIPAFLIFLLVLGRSGNLIQGILLLGNFKENAGKQAKPESDEGSALAIARTADRIVFTLGVVNIGVTAFLIGAAPTKFYYWHTFKVLLLLSLRFHYFHQKKTHYKLFELCYIVNLLSLVYIWVFPTSEAFYKILFALASGPLAWSVLAFKNSLIFHNREQMTSAFIHMSPMILVYGIRWTQSPEFCNPEGFDLSFLSFLSFTIKPILFVYLPWILGYYSIVFVLLGPRAKRKGNKTLFDQLVSEGKATVFQKMTPNDLVNKFLYLLGHFSMGSIAILFTPFLWQTYLGHSLFVFAVCFTATWNAGGHYFQSFAETYEKDLRLKLGLKSKSTENINMSSIDPAILKKVTDNIKSKIKGDGPVNPNAHLVWELGLQSIDITELKGWLEVEFNITNVEAKELETIAAVAHIATTRQSTTQQTTEQPSPPEWVSEKTRASVKFSEYHNIPLSFLSTAFRMNNSVAVADDISGVLTYEKVRIGATMFAEYISNRPQEFPGKRIGIMMPAMAAFPTVALGVMMTGKTPVMMNWTVGSRNLKHMIATSEIKSVITSAKFLEKLGSSVDVKVFADYPGMLKFVEDIKEKFFLIDLTRAKLFHSEKFLTQKFNLSAIKAEDEAVILFTSGSEAAPKGVVLTHGNILSNCKGICEVANILNTDCILGILPPFHSFGFTVTSILPVVSGVKCCYYPNPTDFRQISRQISKWKPTIFLGTPTFLNGVLQISVVEKIKTIRLCVVGAEKAPESLFAKAKELGIKDGVCEGYGITECSPVISCNPIGAAPLGVGKPLSGITVKIIEISSYLEKGQIIELQEQQQQQQEGQKEGEKEGEKEGQQPKAGIIFVSGPSVFSGYLGVASKPFETIDGKRYYNTGDLGYIYKNSIILQGRLKRFVKFAGEMISLPAIESALQSVWPANESGPTVAIEALEISGKTPVIAVFSTIGVTVEMASKVLLSAGVSAMAHPSVAINLPEIPLLGTGKVNFGVLKEKLKEHLENRS